MVLRIFRSLSYHVSCFQFFPKFLIVCFTCSGQLLCTILTDMNDNFKHIPDFFYRQVVIGLEIVLACFKKIN